jgi:hypothetical protein
MYTTGLINLLLFVSNTDVILTGNLQYCAGTGTVASSVSDPDPHFMSSWSRIQKGENSQKEEEKVSPKTRKNNNKLVFSMQS